MVDMEVDLNIEVDSETTQFKNFPFRICEYVASIRERDPEKCWPFASIHDDKDLRRKDSVAPSPQPVETISLFSLPVLQEPEAYEQSPKGIEAAFQSPTASELEIPIGNETGSQSATAKELEVPKGCEIASETARDASTSQTTSNKPTPSTRTTRGVTRLDKVRKRTNLHIEFENVHQRPIGENGAKYTSWVGMEARKKISILEPAWNKVDKHEMNQLWLSIKNRWNISNDNARDATLKIANTSWKNFKKYLIQRFKNKNINPCAKYKFISKETWKKFCALKSTVEFQEKSTQGRAHAQMNTKAHHLGSRGYLGKKEQWAKEKELGISPEIFGILSERARDYLLARRVKVGPGEYVLPDDIQRLAERIIEKDMQMTQGDWVPEAGEDPLTVVLGPEHPGRTRAVSHTVGLRKSLPSLANKKRRRRDRADLEEIARELHEKMGADLEENRRQMQQEMQQIKTRMIEKNDATPATRSPRVCKSSGVGSTACFGWNSIEHPTQCDLVLLCGEIKLVCAKGKAHPIGNGLIHGVQIKEGHVKVHVDLIMEGYGQIPLPHSPDMKKLQDAHNTFIQWPQNAMVLHQV